MFLKGLVLLFGLLAVGYATTNKDTLMTIKKVPQSCLDHFRMGHTENGYYQIHIPVTTTTTTTTNILTVYCDMTSEPGSVWTLIMSYALKHMTHTAFSRTPFATNKPVNAKTPNWNSYRTKLVTMNHIKAQTTHWRTTCNFQSNGVDYTDYVRGNFATFDPMTALGNGICRTVEYVNIRGHLCTYCTTKWWQSHNTFSLHIDSAATGCDLDASSGSVPSENNFGFYLDGHNSGFRCSSTPRATTNWWFGEYL